jgi:hypothetical protein
MSDNIDKLYAGTSARDRFGKIPLTPEISSEAKISLLFRKFTMNIRYAGTMTPGGRCFVHDRK